jgi:2,3-dihydroxyphenylpropionate 1,2-dioxygenase
MNTALVCASHSPLMYCFEKRPAAQDQVEAAFHARAEAVRKFNPELVIVFGPDHYSSLFRRLVPPYCVGAAAAATADLGGHSGRLNVPKDDAIKLVRAVWNDGIDVAFSYDLRVDHGVSQTLHRITGSIDAYPTIPVIFNIMTHPLPLFRRSRLLGEAIGRFARSLGKRTLFIASGGLSHNPVPIFPLYGDGDSLMTSYQEAGPAQDESRLSGWLDRMDSIHRWAADLLGNGKITAADCKFNPDVDGKFLELVQTGRLAELDSWSNEDLIEKAGIGAPEIHGWLAACSANSAAGGRETALDLYVPVLEYGVSVGVVHA